MNMNNTQNIQSNIGIGAHDDPAMAVPVWRSGAPGATVVRHFSRLFRQVMSRGGLLFAGAMVLLMAGCAELPNGPPGAVPPLRQPVSGSGPVVLHEGDTVKLFFPGAPEFNNSQKIRTDGKVSLPLIGEVQAAGKMLSSLQSELAARYKPQLQNSEVVVSLESGGAPVIISGAIATPGKVLLDRPTTLLEAIMGAGGFTDYAKKRKVRLIRVVNGQYQTEVYDMSKGLTGGNTPVVYVKGGDVIYVPQSNW